MNDNDFTPEPTSTGIRVSGNGVIQLLSRCVNGSELTQAGLEIWQSMINDMGDTFAGKA